ncbi:hypothetical protein [Actinomycetospora termitidis]|uniref:Knr4/Smi1-like domain-containing protein n=1 Tax=Actinomycetospora termitidis TaxID=3053470 RepID=A0ABT7MES6_9PSEU|nr:hypothetical protein [Actinomycetospora sp. Odt1-22]MDL5158684.1 hypothetical protein [Actinomycetospora sp. Odt1-22]
MSTLPDLVRRILDGEPAVPAPEADRDLFARRAGEAGVPGAVVAELVALYAVHDGLADETSLGFHPCADVVIFEWWPDDGLWLGQRHFHTTRWTPEHGFARGDATDVMFGPDDAFPTLVDLLAAS